MEDLVTLREASRLTGHSRDALKMRIRRGKLLAVRSNDGLTRVRREDVLGLGDRVEHTSSLGQPRDKDLETLERLVSENGELRERQGELRAQLAAAQERETQLKGQIAKLEGDLLEARKPWIVRVIAAFRGT